jgi:hypothetical protein
MQKPLAPHSVSQAHGLRWQAPPSQTKSSGQSLAVSQALATQANTAGSQTCPSAQAFVASGKQSLSLHTPLAAQKVSSGQGVAWSQVRGSQ